MTPSEIHRVGFTPEAVTEWALLDPRHVNWPVVYVLEEARSSSSRGTSNAKLEDAYVGESLSASGRIKQHFGSPEKRHLRSARVILDDRFNKSVCLDLESYLIRMLAGDGKYRVLNRNDGITDADYFDRHNYREHFRDVFNQLKDDGVFSRGIREIENSDLFKLSPFKALTPDQAIAVEDILEGLFADLAAGIPSTIVIQGAPGTGKTVIAIYLVKLLADIRDSTDVEDLDSDTMFSEFFVPGYRERLANFRIGLVVPQQSLRASIRNVFGKTPGLRSDMVMTAFEAGSSDKEFDLLIVDESHRLNQRANQPSASQNARFKAITQKLFFSDDKTKTQLDWIRARSKHQIFLLDADQSVRPADLQLSAVTALVNEATLATRNYRLESQMRVRAGFDYVGFVRHTLSAKIPHRSGTRLSSVQLGEYDLRLFDSIAKMQSEIRHRDAEFGLSRLIAGYAWKWTTKGGKPGYDIDVDGVQLRWNGKQTDWIASPNAVDEVGSIHTVQGYDLNYAGVIIGPDLGFDTDTRRLVVNRSSYFDVKGMENNALLGNTYVSDNLLRFVTNIYSVLLTRGIRGTYLYVCDPALRIYLSELIPLAH
ncbi:MAG: uncharacterized protein QOH69_998 [Actinomycetota bacterium]|jgi:DUF2075 family protein|nr:uncharacterized protein [Actinomycetota bacterium]